MSDIMQDILDALDEGVACFDARLELQAWNRRFVEIMDFPSALLRRGTPFLAFVDHNIARGEHGAGPRQAIVRQRLDSLHDSYERRRPDGSRIRVRSRPMPDGGLLKLFTLLEPAGAAPSSGPAAGPAFSAREREALLWAARGKTAWETAAILGLSAKTVEFHLASCRRKLGVSTKSQLVLVAAEKGLLPL